MRSAAALLISALAAADPIAPIDVGFSEGIAEEIRDRLWTQLSEGLAEGGFELLPEAGIDEKLVAAAIPSGCVVGPCLKNVGEALSVQYALVARVEGVGSSFDIVLTVMDTESGGPVAQATERCDVCSMMEVEAIMKRSATTLATELKAHANPPPPPPPVVVVRPPPKKPSIWRWPGWKWVSLGLGVAAAGLGTYLVQIDGCTDDACTDQRSTGTPGMIAVGTGVVMMGGAGYLFAFGL